MTFSIFIHVFGMCKLQTFGYCWQHYLVCNILRHPISGSGVKWHILKNFSYSKCESNVHVEKTVNSTTVFERIYFDENNIIKNNEISILHQHFLNERLLSHSVSVLLELSSTACNYYIL